MNAAKGWQKVQLVDVFFEIQQTKNNKGAIPNYSSRHSAIECTPLANKHKKQARMGKFTQ